MSCPSWDFSNFNIKMQKFHGQQTFTTVTKYYMFENISLVNKRNMKRTNLHLDKVFLLRKTKFRQTKYISI